MNQNQELPNNGKNPKFELDQEAIKAIISPKAQEVQLEFQKLKLDEKRLEQDGKLSEKSMYYNNEFLKAYPKQHRQTIITYGAFFTLIFFGALAFIAFCIYRGSSEFAKQFLTVVTHIITLVTGLLVGKQSNKRKIANGKASDP
jgi:lipopolysaccharide export LptBFGC system permease protein LptF